MPDLPGYLPHVCIIFLRLLILRVVVRFFRSSSRSAKGRSTGLERTSCNVDVLGAFLGAYYTLIVITPFRTSTRGFLSGGPSFQASPIGQPSARLASALVSAVDQQTNDPTAPPERKKAGWRPARNRSKNKDRLLRGS